jgi:hypothetical protein
LLGFGFHILFLLLVFVSSERKQVVEREKWQEEEAEEEVLRKWMSHSLTHPKNNYPTFLTALQVHLHGVSTSNPHSIIVFFTFARFVL